jgi:hypothetical protein
LLGRSIVRLHPANRLGLLLPLLLLAGCGSPSAPLPHDGAEDAALPPGQGGASPDAAGGAPDASSIQGTDGAPGSDAAGAADAGSADGASGLAALEGGVNGIPAGYKGMPFKGTPLLIPGTVHASDYDLGGPGVAYCHGNAADCAQGIVTSDWRPPSTPIYRPLSDNAGLCHMNAGEPDNTTTGQLVMPQDVYICYVATTEWLKYTVEVTEAGTYAVGGQMAVPMGVTISLDFGGGLSTGTFPLPVSPTQACKCPETYHSWETVSGLATVTLPAGTYVMTLTVLSAQFNPDFLTFTKM